MVLDTRLLEILACPVDKGPLFYFSDEQSLYNPRLRLRYLVDDGIPVMLVDEAETVNDAEHDRLLAKVRSDAIKPTFDVDVDHNNRPTSTDNANSITPSSAVPSQRSQRSSVVLTRQATGS